MIHKVVAACVLGFACLPATRVKCAEAFDRAAELTAYVLHDNADASDAETKKRLMMADAALGKQLVRFTYDQLRDELESASPDLLISKGIVLSSRVLNWLELEEKVTEASRDLDTYRDFRAEMLVEVARHNAYICRVHFNDAADDQTFLVIQLRMSLIDAQTELVANQLDLTEHRGLSPDTIAQCNGRLERIRTRKNQVLSDLDKTIDEGALGKLDSIGDELALLQRLADDLISHIGQLNGQNITKPLVERTEEVRQRTKGLLAKTQLHLRNVVSSMVVDDPLKSRLNSLLVERCAILIEAGHTFHREQQLAAPDDESVDAHVEFAQNTLEARLDLCETKSERVACLRHYLSQLSAIEANVERYVRVNASPQSSLQTAKAARLGVETALVREQISEGR